MIQTFQIKCDEDLHVQEACRVHGTCKAYKIGRDFVVAASKKLKDLEGCGVYLLLSTDKAYVGEAESVSKRLKQHLKKPPYDWNEAIAFVGVGGASSDWEKSSIKYMEHELYRALVDAKSCDVVNGNTPKKSKVSMPWVWDDQVQELKLILPYLGYPTLFTNKQLPEDRLLSKRENADGVGGEFPYKVGKTVQVVFPYLFEEGLIAEKHISYLMSADAVKRFRMRGHPILFRTTGKSKDGFDKRGVRMFYPGILLKRGEKSYLLSNQFYREALVPLLEWFREIGVPPSKVVSLCNEKYGTPEP